MKHPRGRSHGLWKHVSLISDVIFPFFFFFWVLRNIFAEHIDFFSLHVNLLPVEFKYLEPWEKLSGKARTKNHYYVKFHLCFFAWIVWAKRWILTIHRCINLKIVLTTIGQRILYENIWTDEYVYTYVGCLTLKMTFYHKYTRLWYSLCCIHSYKVIRMNKVYCGACGKKYPIISSCVCLGMLVYLPYVWRFLYLQYIKLIVPTSSVSPASSSSSSFIGVSVHLRIF